MTRNAPPAGLPFMKMHGLGNDFVILDARTGDVPMTAALARGIGDRHFGVGFDQLAVIRQGSGGADLDLAFWNADGSLSSTCGNATRCIAAWEMARRGVAALRLRTERGVLTAEDAGDGLVRVNMGTPMTDWRDIPLSEEVDTLHLPVAGDPVATGMGNPHCTFFVPDAAAVDLPAFGAAQEHHPLFPERTNVEVVQVLDTETIRLRIWERGTGVTLASGSCASAAAVAAARRGLTGREVAVQVDGGTLFIDWREDGVWMAGPTAHIFDGILAAGFLSGLA